MSIRVMSHIWDHGPDDRSELLVLLALADFCNDEGMCWPGMRAVAKKARLSERGAQKIILRLIETGWLMKEENAGRRGTNVYRILPVKKEDPTPEPGSPPNGVHPRTPVHPPPEPGFTPPLNPGSPEPSKNHHRTFVRNAPARGKGRPATGSPTDRVENSTEGIAATARLLAEKAKAGKQLFRVSGAMRQAMLDLGLVTPDELRRAGVAP